jgi:hypothetical protein
MNWLATHSKNKNIRDLYTGINKFKKSYKPRTNLVNVENDELLVDSHNILNRWKKHFSQLLNVHRISDVRQIEIHVQMAGPLVPESTPLEAEISIAKMMKYILPGPDQITVEQIQAGGEILRSEVHKIRQKSP